MLAPDSPTCTAANAASPSAAGYEVLARHLADVHGVHARGTRSQLDAAHDRARQVDADIRRAARLVDSALSLLQDAQALSLPSGARTALRDAIVALSRSDELLEALARRAAESTATEPAPTPA